MQFTEIATEQTTAATNILLGLVSLYVLRDVRRHGRSRDNRKTRIWSIAFGLLACAAFLGAVVHGLELSAAATFRLWQPIYLALGLTVAVFLVGAVYDLRRFIIPGWLFPGALLLGVAFYLVTLIGPDMFYVFVIYEAVVLVIAFFCYLSLAVRGRLEGAWLMMLGVLTSIAAAVLQATGEIHIVLVFEFDHNGVFHLVQTLGVLFFMWGLRAELRSRVNIGGSVASSVVGSSSRL